MKIEHSDKVRKLQERVEAFMAEHVYPTEEDLFAQVGEGNRWQPVPLLEELKAKARATELWNLFLPESEYGAGLTNLEYAPLCEIMGRSPWAPEVFNCSAPVPATWKSWCGTAHRSSAGAGSSRCSPARSARPSR